MAHDLGKNAGGQNVAVSRQRELSISNFPVSTILSGESPRKCAQEKIRIIPLIPPADESGYLPKPPTAKQFADCCNEFWWVSAYASKGL